VNPNLLKALIRTLTPLVYSSVAAVIAHFGYHVSNSTVIQIVSAGFAGLTVLLHSAEVKWPWVGGLLGWFGAPQYTPSTKTTVVSLEAQVAALTAQLEEAAHPTVPSAPVVSAPVVTAPPTPIIPPVTPYVG